MNDWEKSKKAANGIGLYEGLVELLTGFQGKKKFRGSEQNSRS